MQKSKCAVLLWTNNDDRVPYQRNLWIKDGKPGFTSFPKFFECIESSWEKVKNLLLPCKSLRPIAEPG